MRVWVGCHESCWVGARRTGRRIRHLWNGCMRKGAESLEHPTQKPVEVMAWCLSLRWTKDCGLVLDPFMGSGTTPAACQNLRRHCIGIELGKDYFDIATERVRENGRQVRMEI